MAVAFDADEAVDVLVAIVTFNSGNDVFDAVGSVGPAAGDLRTHIVVADNASTDGVAHRLRHSRADVSVIEMGSNTGFARANNRAFSSTDSDAVLTLNPDAVLQSGSLLELVAFARAHPNAGVVAPALRFPDGRDQRTARSFPTAAAGLFGRRSPLTRMFPGNRWSKRFLDPTGNHGRPTGEPFRCDWVSGACMLVPRSVLDRVGGFDEKYFLFWEDADWCKRIVDAGYEVWTVPTAVVVHDEGGSRQHGWPTPVTLHFHRGAYRYWRTHVAPQWWNPLRWLAAIALGGRAALLITVASARRARRAPRSRTDRVRSVPPAAEHSGRTPAHRPVEFEKEMAT